MPLLAVLPEILLVALQCVAQTFVVAGAGLYLGRRGLLPSEVTRGLSLITAKVTVPALLFTKVLSSVDLLLITRAWPLLILPVVYATAGCLLGRLVIFLFKPDPSFRSGTIAAVAFGNSTIMPLLLLYVVDRPLDHWFPGSNADCVVFLSVYLLTYPVIQWVVGSWLLVPLPDMREAKRMSPKPKLQEVSSSPAVEVDPPLPPKTSLQRWRDELRDRFEHALRWWSISRRSIGTYRGLGTDLNASLLTMEDPRCAETGSGLPKVIDTMMRPPLGSGPHKADELAPPEPLHRSPFSVSEHLENGEDSTPPPAMPPWRSNAIAMGREFAKFVWQRVLVPPVVAVLVGLASSSSPIAYWILCGGTYGHRLPQGTRCPEVGAMLGWFTAGLVTIGQAAGPIGLFLIGNALSRGPDWRALDVRTNLAIVVAKMVAMPLVALGCVTAWSRISPLPEPWSHYAYMTALTVSATPTANNVIIMTEMAGGNRAAMGTSIFTQYVCSPFLLTGSLTVFMLAARFL